MSEYLDRKQVIELYTQYHPCMATHVYEFGEKLMALPIVEIPLAELDTTNDFAKWIDVNGDGSLWKCSRCSETSCCRGKYCCECGASMSANDEQVTGKLNEEPKDSHSEYWNSIGEWKEGEAE